MAAASRASASLTIATARGFSAGADGFGAWLSNNAIANATKSASATLARSTRLNDDDLDGSGWPQDGQYLLPPTSARPQLAQECVSGEATRVPQAPQNGRSAGTTAAQEGQRRSVGRGDAAGLGFTTAVLRSGWGSQHYRLANRFGD